MPAGSDVYGSSSFSKVFGSPDSEIAWGVAAALGYAGANASGDITGARMAALAAGGLLAMMTNSLMPFAYERGGELAGLATVVGFCLALGGS